MATAAPAAPAPSAAPPAAPPPSPAPIAAPAAPASQDPDDLIDSVRRDAIALGHRGIQEPAEPAAEDGSTPAPAEQPPAETSEGSTPAEASPPAPSAAQLAALEPLIKRYGSVEEAAKQFFETEKRAAESARRLKELESGRTPAQPEAAPAPAPAEPPAPTPPQPAVAAQPEHPALPRTQEEFDQVVFQAVEADDECKAFAVQHQEHRTRIAAIEQEVPTINNQLAALQLAIDRPDVDEFTKAEWQKEAEKLDNHRERLLTEHARREAQVDNLSRKFSSRIDQHRSAVQSRLAENARQAERAQRIERHQADFQKTWEPAFESEFKASGLPAELHDGVHRRILAMAHAHNGVIEPASFLKEAMAAEVADYSMFERVKFRDYALRKNADTQAPAPAGAVAVAPPADPASADPEALTKLMLRQAFAKRR